MTRYLDDDQLANISAAGDHANPTPPCGIANECVLPTGAEKDGSGPGQAPESTAPGNDPGELNRRF